MEILPNKSDGHIDRLTARKSIRPTVHTRLTQHRSQVGDDLTVESPIASQKDYGP